MSLTLTEARDRATLLSDVAYDLHFDLTDRAAYRCRAVVRFRCSRPGASTFLELSDATEVLVDGRPAAAYDGSRLVLDDLSADNEVTIEARIPYVTDGEGMHTFTDPADGLTYVGAFVGMDVAQRVFPCFDQNDLKAPVTVSARVPDGWSVLANGRLDAVDGDTWRFGTTPPIPLPMFTVCAGPWHTVAWEHAGTPFAWHARASLADQLDRDAEELQRVTVACFDHYLELFREPFAYGSYDQVFVPGLNWGALENPGCVTYRDELLPVGTPTRTERRRRGMVIAHEMAHQWFGNLTTMTWWEDTWLQESFADYMGFRVAADAAGFEGAFVDFSISQKVGGYAADERRSTHPVAPLAEEVRDVDEATNNFDAISYAKGNSAIRQLVTWLGDDAFLAGVRTYFGRHRHGNATLDDFVDALDSATDRDVRAWVEAWLRTSGFDTVRVERDGDEVVLTREGSRPHRFEVALLDEELLPVASHTVDLADEPVRLPAAAVVVPNAAGETFARLRLDAESWRVLAADLALVERDDTRAIVWSTAMDMVRCGDLSPEDFLGLVTRHLPRERNTTLVDAVLAWTTGTLVVRHLEVAQVRDALAQVAAACETGLASDPGTDVAVALTRRLAATSPDPRLLAGWLAESRTHTGLEVDRTLRWLVVARLASLGALDAEAIAAEREADGSIRGVLGAATALAAIPTPEAKATAWERLMGDPPLSNREFEATAAGFWHPEHAALVAEFVPRYLTDGLALARSRGAGFEDMLGRAFPAVPLTDDQVGAVAAALQGTGDRAVPTVLRRFWEDRYDDLLAGRR